MSADNQQERPDERVCHYIAGFVDGEGSFHIAVQRSKETHLGLQVIPEFHVSQNRDKTSVLELVRTTLQCGYIKPNHFRCSNDLTNVLVVRNRRDLSEKVIPFFRQYQLLSSKQSEFEKFAKVVEIMNRQEHLKKEGLEKIIKIAFSMYDGKYRKKKLDDILSILESSETVRQTKEDTVRTA